MINYNIKINMQGERELCEDILFTSGDKKGYRLNLSFYSNGKLYDTSGCALTVKSKRADGAVIIDSGVCAPEGVYYDVADNAIAIEGELQIEVALVRANGEYVTTAVIFARVRNGFGEAGLLSSDNEPVLAKLEAQALVTYAKANSAAEMLKKECKMLANALKGRAKGEQVTLNDVSPIEHDIEIKVSDNNVLPFPYQETSKTDLDLTFTVNDDGSITINGTSDLRSFALYRSTSQTVLEKGKTYRQSLRYANGDYVDSGMWLYSDFSTDGKTWDTENYAKGNTTFTAPEHKGYIIMLNVGMGTYDNVTVYPQIEEVIEPASISVIAQDANGVEIERTTLTEDCTAKLTSASPIMNILTNTSGVVVECIYNRDTNVVIKELMDGVYTPVKGVDYWNEEDKAEIKSYVDEAILGGVW